MDRDVTRTMAFLLVWLLHELSYPVVLLLVICFLYVKFASINRFIRSKTRQNVLLVIGHPDDECMFFAPTILSLLHEGHNIYLVCMSKGDFYGQGDIRKKELQASCSKLGILPSRVTIVDDERFKDGPDSKWNIEDLGEQILSVVKRVSADSIITFDDQGVSGHENHIAISRAVEKLHKSKRIENVSVFMLETTNIVRKYISFLDIIITSIFSLTTFVSLPSEVIRGWQAMFAHQSQLVWFRKLYIVFSRYMYVNNLRELRE